MNVRAIHTKNLKWIDIVSPGAAEIDFLKKNYSFHPLDLQDVAATSQHTKVEARDTYQFIVMLFPIFDRKAREIKPAEVDIFIGKGYLITIHDGSMFTMTDMVAGTIEHEELRRGAHVRECWVAAVPNSRAAVQAQLPNLRQAHVVRR